MDKRRDGFDFEREAVLDADIQFTEPLSEFSAEPRAVLLTGATGFLGAYLLDELLNKTDAVIYCLIRAKNAENAIARLKEKLTFYTLWQEERAQRIVPIVGDLSKPCLGIAGEQYDLLAGTIDLIIHNGAHVNAMYPYARLKASNVLGTQEVLRLASRKQTKPVHFVSTLGVFFSDNYVGQTITEDEVIVNDGTMKGGYKQSKWVAEELVQIAQRRGLPSAIYRAGRIWGDSRTGIMNQFSDLLGTLVQAGIHLEKFPTADTTLNLIPVDFVSQAIVHLAQQPQSNGQIFHLCNPDILSWQTLWHKIRDTGYPVEEVSYKEWAAAIKVQAREQRGKKLYSILRHLLRSPIYMFSAKPRFDASQTQTTLAQAGIHCPVIDKPLLNTYLSSFQASGYIPIP